MIQWNKYFDRIYCLHFIPFIERKQLMDFQLDRVGILHSSIFEYHYEYGTYSDKIYDNYVREHSIGKMKEISDGRVVSIIFNHYNAIREAYSRGCKRILILENDVRFLKNLNQIEQILEHRPKDANLILYDKFIFDYKMAQQFKSVNDYFSTWQDLSSASCYQLDRKGMKKIIQKEEKFLVCIDWYFYYKELEGLNYYCSTKNMAVQGFFRKNNMQWDQEKTDSFGLSKYYKYLNINFDDYMMRKDGSPYYYGDFIDY